MMTNKDLAQTLLIAAKAQMNSNIPLGVLLTTAAERIDPSVGGKPVDKDASLQVIWEQLNGVMHDLVEVRDKANDSINTVEDCIVRLEAIGVHANEGESK